jgi:hypothetical protein
MYNFTLEIPIYKILQNLTSLKAMLHGAIFLAMQFYSWEMLISEISEEFSIC